MELAFGMGRKARALGIFFAMVAVGSAAHGQKAASAPQSSRSPLSLDVAGVRLGMPIGQVHAVLASNYRCETAKGATTFAQQVEDEVKVRRTGSSGRWNGGLGTDYDRCVGPGGEELMVRYAEISTGAIVDDISLKLPSSRFDAAETMRQVHAKYGRPSLPGDGSGEFWCDRGYRCGLGRALVEGPQVQARTDVYGAYVDAMRGQRAHAADMAAVMATADAVAPKKTRGAF